MKIAVVGPQNTGKTTFIQDFIREYPSFSLPTHTYRDIIKERGMSLNKETTIETQTAIRGFMVEQAVSSQGDVIMDRCLIDNYVYTVWKTKRGEIGEYFKTETFLVLVNNLKHYDKILFIPFDHTIPLVDSTNRNIDPTYIRDINALFIEVLLQISKLCNITVISGSREERMNTVREKLGLTPEV